MNLLAPFRKWIGRAVVEAAVESGVVGKSQGLPAWWFARAIEVGGQESLSEPYKHSVWVQSAIAKIAGPVAAVPVCFFKPGREMAGLPKGARARARARARNTKAFRTGSGIVRRDLDDQIEMPIMQQFLRAPMRGLGYADFVEACVGWLCMKGEWFWIPTEDTRPFPEVARKGSLQVIVARPDRMREVVEDGELQGWEFKDKSGKPRYLTPNQLIQEKRWNPYNDWRGLAQYEAAQIAAEGDWLAGKFSRNLMANNGDTGPYIIAKSGIPSNDQREQILADLRAKRHAQQRGDFRPIFMTGDIAVEDPKVRTVDAQFIGMRTNSREEVFAAFNVPPSLSQVKEAYSIGSASDFYQLITTTCVPVGEKFADALERLTKLLTGEEVEVLLDWDDHPVMQEVRKERFVSVDVFWNKGMPMEQINDYLGLEMPEYPGWDRGYLPMSLVPAEEVQAAPEPTTSQEFGEETTDNADNTEQEQEQEQEKPGAVREMMKALRTGRKAGANARLWESHMRKRQATVRQYESKVGRVLSEFRAIALSKMGAMSGLTKSVERGAWSVEGKSLIDVIFDPAKFGERLVASINPVTQAAIQTAADVLRTQELGLTDPWKFPPQKVVEFINGRTQSVQNCGQTVRNQLNTTLEEGYAGGETMEQLTDRVRGVFNGLAKHESKRIAMTESACSWNFSRHETMAAAGVKYKKWLSSHGPTVRPGHAAAEKEYAGNPIPIDEPFLVAGEELMYPGDPNGSPENIINCQCVSLAVEKP